MQSNLALITTNFHLLFNYLFILKNFFKDLKSILSLLIFFVKFTFKDQFPANGISKYNLWFECEWYSHPWQKNCHIIFFSNIMGTLIGTLQSDKQYLLTKTTEELLSSDIEFINILSDLTRYIKQASFEKISTRVFINYSLKILVRHFSANPNKLCQVNFII